MSVVARRDFLSTLCGRMGGPKDFVSTDDRFGDEHVVVSAGGREVTAVLAATLLDDYYADYLDILTSSGSSRASQWIEEAAIGLISEVEFEVEMGAGETVIRLQ